MLRIVALPRQCGKQFVDQKPRRFLDFATQHSTFELQRMRNLFASQTQTQIMTFMVNVLQQLCQRPVIESICTQLILDDIKALTLVCRALCNAVSPLIGSWYVIHVQHCDVALKAHLRFHVRQLYWDTKDIKGRSCSAVVHIKRPTRNLL